MSQTLKPVDDTQEPDEDSYETDPKLLNRLKKQYGIWPELDAAAKDYNTKCQSYLDDALHQEWLKAGRPVDVWCNPPHSLNEEFVRRADAQHQKYGMNIMMIIPTNTESSGFFQDIIEDELKEKVENHPIRGRPKFFKNGRETKHNSRNAYRVIIWRHSKNV